MLSYLTYPPIDTSVFPEGYGSARASLLNRMAPFSAAQHKVFECPGRTPAGERLATDSLWLGSSDASKVLVLLSGTHGVEGFAGSGVLFDLLELINKGHIALADNIALLIAHALTPWGYAWLRRCDEDGVDLNRNYVDFTQPLPDNPGYEDLKSQIKSLDKIGREAAFAAYIAKHGRTAYEIAVSGGQYSDPEGPFYGGKKPAHGRQVTEDLIHCFNLAERDLAVIDIHTGLGPFGYGELICDHPPGNPGVDRAQGWYGDSVTLPAMGTSSSVPKTGLMDYAWHEIMNQRSCHVTLEFGTYPTGCLFEVLLRDHLLWSKKDNLSDKLAHGKQMLHHFCPNDDNWKASVLFRARQVIWQALQGLSGRYEQ
jgi:hypothetical protein